MLKVRAKRTENIDDLILKLDPGDVDNKKTILTNNSVFNAVTEKYSKLLESISSKLVYSLYYDPIISSNEFVGDYNRKPQYFEDLENKLTDVLTQDEINAFLQYTIHQGDDKNYGWFTGIFTSILIQNSYASNNNDFILNTRNLNQIRHLGYRLRGTSSRPLKLTINSGNIMHFGNFISHANITINNDKCISLYQSIYHNKSALYIIKGLIKEAYQACTSCEGLQIITPNIKTLKKLINVNCAEVYLRKKNGDLELVKDGGDR